ncbi:DNA helicase/exodeoxyribonuclease V alpha subunit [Orbus hercynius]|uniref:RecBCD enzyme subunit RecD n=1 Tax=Orbus hercynius TaxID=593135 RepID=A0A495RIJ8_9GAMM|nr:exodeoxyribonuclease V subunit alpha [Orbus hercynius]RKS87094.1 DNA helicase/exodeoxyribonuclease V alpha subunit [Orbus hercynius]
MGHIALLDKLKSSGMIMPLDYHLALFFIRQSKLTDSLALSRFAFLIVWLNIEVRAGHVCINITQITKHNLEYRFGREYVTRIFSDLDEPTWHDWIKLCERVGQNIISDGSCLSPLIRNDNRIYFQRMWLYEKHVAAYFNSALTCQVVERQANQLLNDLFPSTSASHDIDWQKVAAALAVIHPVAIISGGPGTGKTTTISKILAVLVSMHQHDSLSPLRIVAAAPTGKAAARLTESLSKAISTLPVPKSIKQRIPIEALTLHRLLGASSNNRQYRYHQGNPLSIDILLIDEASMIDLPMMSSVIAALPNNARLILLGDKEQLSSVEAGAVFGDLCAQLQRGYSEQQVQMISQLTGYVLEAKSAQVSIADHVCLLQKSYRFSSESGIGLLANAIKAGRYPHVMTLLQSKNYSDLTFHEISCRDQYQQAVEQCANNYLNYLQIIISKSNDIKTILDSFAQFRLLCALREGPFGVLGLNEMIERLLAQKKVINLIKRDGWYIGRPIMILKNSFSLGLFNGDIGITLPSLDDANKLKVYFLLPNGEIKGVAPFRLPEHETAYAMTIHKSQGSEFGSVSIILPNEYSPLLTRSLLYTAVTRAKNHITLYSPYTIIEKTINTQIERQSGLANLLI